MRITLHDDIEGHKSGETIDVAEDRAKWYLANGYASAADYNRDEDPKMSVDAKLDPTLAKNRDDKPNADLRDQLADGLGRNRGDDTDDVRPMTKTSGHEPVELTNGKGNPEKAAAGKDEISPASPAVVDSAALLKEGDETLDQSPTDPAGAPEQNPELVEQRAKEADKAGQQSAKIAEQVDKGDVDPKAAEGATTPAEVKKATTAARKADES